MDTRKKTKKATQKTTSLNSFAARVLSVGQIELKPHQWLLPKSVSKFWSIYVPDSKGLLLGQGKSEVEVPAGSMALVPPGASAARDNSKSLNVVFLHFDIGGYPGIALENLFTEMMILPVGKYQLQIDAIKEVANSGPSLYLQMCSQAFLSGVLAESVSGSHRSGMPYSEDNPAVQNILSVLHAIEERLDSPVYVPLKVEDMAKMCGMKPVVFSRAFFEVLEKNPAEYALKRKIAAATQQLLFTGKSIDEITASFAFANRFYFSRVFKDEVGETPAAYRSAFQGKKTLADARN